MQRRKPCFAAVILGVKAIYLGENIHKRADILLHEVVFIEAGAGDGELVFKRLHLRSKRRLEGIGACRKGRCPLAPAAEYLGVKIREHLGVAQVDVYPQIEVFGKKLRVRGGAALVERLGEDEILLLRLPLSRRKENGIFSSSAAATSTARAHTTETAMTRGFLLPLRPSLLLSLCPRDLSIVPPWFYIQYYIILPGMGASTILSSFISALPPSSASFSFGIKVCTSPLTLSAMVERGGWLSG